MESKKIFGDYILQKRKETGLTQKGFAEKLYITESAVSKWERGISYPDISMIKDMCEILGVSERELLEATEDTQTRANEKLARKYIKLTQRFKWAQIIIYGAALITCFICNLAVNHTLSWFFIVMAALMLASSLTFLPILIKKHRGLITLGGFTFTLLLLLLVCSIYTAGGWYIMAAISVIFGFSLVFLPYIIRNIWLAEPLANHKALLYMIINTLLLFIVLFVASWYTRGGWFLGKGLPLAAFWLAIPWGIMLIVRYAKMNKLLKTAACIGVVTLISFVFDGFTLMIVDGAAMHLGVAFDFNNWNMETLDANIKMLFSLSLLLFATAFTIAGSIVAFRKHSE